MRHKTMLIKRKNQQGSTIIEVVLAILIFAGALLALIDFQGSLMRTRNAVNQEAVALTIINDKMQSFRKYTTLVTTPGQFAYADIIGTGASPINVVSGNATYSMSISVTDLLSPTRKNVSISVKWTDPAKVPHTVAIVSVIASIDPNLTGRVSENLP